MRYKVVFYPMYEETLVVESMSFDSLVNGTDFTSHYTLKTPAARKWERGHLLRELADRLDGEKH
jgi:hypothetical protein